MDTQTSTMPVEAGHAAAASIPASRRLYWSLRRELWENRSIYLAPLGVAAVVVAGFLILHLQQVRAAAALDSMQQREAIAQPYNIAAALLMLTFLIVAAFYCVEALQRERRDRSILFWKSLPVSDGVTVLAKTSIPFVVLPLLTFAVTVATQLIMLLGSSVALAGSGLSVANYWAQVALFQSSLLLLYHLMTVHVLWSAPVWGWLLLVSAWARRAAFLWAVLPPLAIVAMEKLLFNTSHFADFLKQRFLGRGMEALTAPGTMPMDPMTHLTPGRFFGAPELWIGLALTAAFLVAAARLRRARGAN